MDNGEQGGSARREERKTGERRRGIKGRRQEQEERWRSRTSALAARCRWTRSHEHQKKLGGGSLQNTALFILFKKKKSAQGCKDAQVQRYKPKNSSLEKWNLMQSVADIMMCTNTVEQAFGHCGFEWIIYGSLCNILGDLWNGDKQSSDGWFNDIWHCLLLIRTWAGTQTAPSSANILSR